MEDWLKCQISVLVKYRQKYLIETVNKMHKIVWLYDIWQSIQDVKVEHKYFEGFIESTSDESPVSEDGQTPDGNYT